VECVAPGEGTPIQDAVDGAGAGDVIYVQEGTNARECGCVETGTLVGDGADVCGY